MRNTSTIKKYFHIVATMSMAIVIANGAAQTSTLPVVDLSLGPLAVTTQATNVALALSVEFPTVGAAYRNGLYDHNTTYLGYWDSKACYDYLDATVGAPLSGEYFYRTGSVDADKYCNTASSGTGYSGNVLNYVATSSIDLLRLALTGGDRVTDTSDTTVLGRAFLRSGWLNNASNFPSRRIPASLEGKVTPDFPDSTTADVYAGSCDDKVVFGRANTSTNCNNPGTSGNLNKQRPNPSTLTTDRFLYGETPPTGLTGFTLGTVTWEISSPLRTSTVAPTAGPTTDTFTYYATAPGTTTTVPPGGVGLPTNVVSVTYTESGTSTTPTIGAPNVSVQYYTTSTSNRFDTTNPGSTTDAQVSNASRGQPVILTRNSHRNINVCNSTAGGRIVGQLSSGSPTSISACPASGLPSYASASPGTRRNLRTSVSPNWPNSNGSETVTAYELYNLTPIYKRYTVTNNYNNFTILTGYNIHDQWQYYTYYTGTIAGPMYARVKVCDSSEATTRVDLCQRYPSGGYKPVGEIQKKSESLRIAAFGYLMDDTRARYGGVLRAPMRFPGPTYKDSSGNIQTNSAPEWDATTGIFTVDPLGASPTFPNSGVINYLNKFGRTGVYKTYDPVGELYYEVLRYFQGLGPTAAASSGLTAGSALYDNYPVYNTVVTGTATTPGWRDPIENACQRRNFALVIGDNNTHNDRQLPGHGSGVSSALVNADDPARSQEPLLGDASKYFNVVDWTNVVSALETGANVSYVDALGRTQNTTGNPSPNASNNNLASKGTGATNAGYYWAGAAYWANTQSIRLDTINGQSAKDVRLKTFVIDVDEYGNGSYQPTRSFAIAGKYGWFSDANLDGNPYRTSGGLVNNSEWQDADVPGTPEGYVVASQAQKMIDGIKKFFAAVVSERGTVSVSSLSSQRFTTRSPNGDLYAPRFDSRDWSGTVIKSALKLNTTTGTIDALQGVTWDAGAILTASSLDSQASPLAAPKIRPQDRKIFSYSRDTSNGTGVEFKSSNFAALDSAVQTSLNTDPATNTVDSRGTLRVDFFRGDRSNEKIGSTGFFRRRSQIMGDVLNSGPVYKKAPSTGINDAGYMTFSQTWSNRTGTVYVGANDGMLHAFRETDGKELFAYVPRAVSTKLNKLTNPAYVHDAYVDGVPFVSEAKIGNDWKTVLVSGMGGGAQGIFVLDVTDPENFSTSNVLFEFTDQDDPMMGNVLTQPQLVKVKVAGGTKWFIAVGSGYNNYKNDGNSTPSGDQALFLLSLDKAPGVGWSEGTNYYKITVPAASSTIANGLGNPGIAYGPGGVAIAMYAGDLQGQLWKFTFSDELSTTNLTANLFMPLISGAKKPIFTATDAGNKRQPITISPMIAPSVREGRMIVFGTGKFMEQTDPDSTDVQAIYSVWDSDGYTTSDFSLTKTDLQAFTATEGTTTVALSTNTFTIGSGTGKKRGCYFNLPGSKERVVVEGASGLGTVSLVSTIPTGSCSGDGEGRLYEFSPTKCALASEVQAKNQIGFLSRPSYVDVVLSTGSNYSDRTTQGSRTVSVKEGVLITGTSLTEAGNVQTITRSTGSGTGTLADPKVYSGQLTQREIRDFRN